MNLFAFDLNLCVLRITTEIWTDSAVLDIKILSAHIQIAMVYSDWTDLVRPFCTGSLPWCEMVRIGPLLISVTNMWWNWAQMK